MGVVPRRAALAVALAAVFSLGAMPLNLSAAAPPSPPPAQAGGTYQQPQDGQAATPETARSENPA